MKCRKWKCLNGKRSASTLNIRFPGSTLPTLLCAGYNVKKKNTNWWGVHDPYCVNFALLEIKQREPSVGTLNSLFSTNFKACIASCNLTPRFVSTDHRNKKNAIILLSIEFINIKLMYLFFYDFHIFSRLLQFSYILSL